MNTTPTWKVTLKTGPSRWTITEVPAATHVEAIATARRLIGNYPVSEVE